MSIFNANFCYQKFYMTCSLDNSLNRYFSLIGSNDPVAFYLGKADRKPYYEFDDDEFFTLMEFKDKIPSLGDNGFFIRRETFLKADLEHYYPMDCMQDLIRMGKRTFLRMNGASIWHRTSDNLFTFLRKRYKYARDLYSDRQDRRWKMLDTKEDYQRLLWFIASTLTVIPCLLVSLRGFRKIQDTSWFLHWPVCFGFLVTYTLLVCRNLLKWGNLFQRPLSSLPLTVQKV